MEHFSFSRTFSLTVATLRALSLILPFLYLSLLSCEIVQRVDKPTEALQYIMNDNQWFLADPINTSINTSAQLKQASALSMLGHQQLSLDVLSSLQVQTKSLCVAAIILWYIIQIYREF